MFSSIDVVCFVELIIVSSVFGCAATTWAHAPPEHIAWQVSVLGVQDCEGAFAKWVFNRASGAPSVFGPHPFLYIRVLACRGLPKMDTFGTCDPYVVVTYSEQGNPSVWNGMLGSGPQRTLAKKGTQNPDFTEADHNMLFVRVFNNKPEFFVRFFDQDMTADEQFGLIRFPPYALGPLLERGAVDGGVFWLPIASTLTGQLSAGWVALQMGVAHDAPPPPPPVPLPTNLGNERGPTATAPAFLQRLGRFLLKYNQSQIGAILNLGAPAWAEGRHEQLMNSLVQSWGPEPTQ